MSWLGDIYNSAKKKLQDWEQPIQQSVSSNLGKMADNTKNWFSNTTQNVDNFVAPKIQSFDNTFIKAPENFVQQTPSKVASYFRNDQTAGGMGKNTLFGLPAATKTIGNGIKSYFNNDATLGGTAKNTLYGMPKAAADIASNPMKIGDSLEQFDYLKPTDHVRVRDFARELPGAILQTGKDMLSNTERLVKQSGNTFGTALAYKNPFGIMGKYKKEDVNLNDLPTVPQVIGSTAGSILELAPWSEDLRGMMAGGKFLNSANPIVRTVAGAVPGYAYDVASKIGDQGVKPSSFIPGMGTAFGGAFGFSGKPAAEGITKEATNVKQDLENLINPTSKRIVTKMDYAPVEGNFSGGQPMMKPVIGSERKVVETVQNPFEPKSITGKVLSARPGLNIEDVNMKEPRVLSSSELDARIANKRADAAELVNKQIGNQKAGSNVAEPGFVPPQDVPVPAPNPETKSPFPTIEEYVAGKAPEAPAPIDNKLAKQNFQEKKAAMGQSLSFFDDQLDSQYANFKKLYNRFSSGKGRDAFESMDPQSIKNYLNGKVSPTEIDNILYSQSKKPDEVLDMFMTMKEKENAFKNLKAPTLSERDKAMAKSLGLPEDKIPGVKSGVPFENDIFKTENYNRWQKAAYDAKGRRIKSIGELMNMPRELSPGGYTKREIQGMGATEQSVKSALLRQGFPKDVIEKMQPETARNLVDKGINYHSLPNQDTLNEVKLKITGNTEQERVQSAIVNAERVRQEISVRGQDAYLEGRKLSKNDLRLAEQYEHGVPINQIAQKAENPAQVTNYLNSLRDYYDFRLAVDRAVGGETPRRENYMRHIWDLTNPEDLARFNELTAQRGLRPWNGFSAQPRTFKTYAEGESLGFRRLNPNTIEDLKTDFGGASHALSKQTLSNGLYQAVPEKVSMTGTGMTKEGKPFINSNIPGLEGLSYAPEIHDMLKGYQPRTNKDFINMAKQESDGTAASFVKNIPKAMKDAGFFNTVGTLYDHATQPMKHFMLNFAGFHSINISANYAGANLFEMNLKGSKGMAESIPAFFSEGVTQKIINGIKSKGIPGTNLSVFDAGLRSGVNMERGMPAAGLKRLNPFSASTRAIFDRELYTLKLNLVDQVFGNGKVNPESPQGRALGKEINMIMGEMNNRTMNLNPNTQKWFSRLLLAPQFTESKYALIGKAVTKNPVGGNSIALKAALGKSIVMGSLATFGTLIMTGKFPNLQQMLLNFTTSPETQTNLTNPKGRKLALSWPKTFVSEPLGLVTDPIHYGQARLNPALSDMLSVASNQDYYGNPIIDPNSKKSTLEQVGRNVALGDLPIGVQNMVSLGEGKQTGPQTAINIAGLRAHVDPSDPTSIYFKNLDDARAGLKNPNDISAWEIIHPVNKTSGGEYIIQPTIWDSANKATTYLSHPAVLEADTKMNQSLAQQGQKVDPFFSLSPDQQKVALTYATLPPQDPQRSRIEGDNKWMPDFQKQRSDFFATLPASNPDKPKAPIEYPQPSPEVETLQNQYYQITDPKQRAAFLDKNPDLPAQFAANDRYSRDIRTAKNLPLYDSYPQPDPSLQKVMDDYGQLPKGTGARSAWIKVNPDLWNKMITYYSQNSLYNIEKSAQQAAFQNVGFDSKGLGAIKNLGQDIAQGVDANGNKIYALAPGAGGGGGYGYSGGAKAKYASLINNADADPIWMAINRTRAFGSNPTKYRVKIGKHVPAFRPVQLAKATRRAGRIIHLNKLA